MSLGPTFEGGGLPLYHPELLLVKARPSSTISGLATMAGMAPPAVSFETSGLSALAFYSRAGMIKRITPLSEPERSGSFVGPTAFASALAFSVQGRSANAGVSVIELESEAERIRLQTALAGDPNFEFVSPVPVRYLAASRAARPRPLEEPAAVGAPPLALWNLAKIRWPEARKLAGFTDARKIRVAVLDTGIDQDHPDLRGRVASYKYRHPDNKNASSADDIIGHGTHVAGTIGASIDNSLGVNGICAAELHIWKIFDDAPDLSVPRQAYVYYVEPVMYRRALADCLDQGIDVINLSIGGPGRPDAQEQFLFERLLAAGTAIVAAMGNERQDGSPVSYPAAIPDVIAVGATDIGDDVTGFSNRGGHISLCAPGEAIWSCLPTYAGQAGFDAVRNSDGSYREGKPRKRDTNYGAWSGTSMATPHITGAVALLLAKMGAMKPADVRRALTSSADKVPNMKGEPFDSDFGAGRLNLARLLE